MGSPSTDCSELLAADPTAAAAIFLEADSLGLSPGELLAAQQAALMHDMQTSTSSRLGPAGGPAGVPRGWRGGRQALSGKGVQVLNSSCSRGQDGSPARLPRPGTLDLHWDLMLEGLTLKGADALDGI
eukprot:gene1770-2109_t